MSRSRWLAVVAVGVAVVLVAVAWLASLSGSPSGDAPAGSGEPAGPVLPSVVAGIVGAPLVVEGSGFGAPGLNRSLQVSWDDGGRVVASTDPAVLHWSDGRVEVDLGDALRPGRLSLHLDAGGGGGGQDASARLEVYAYDWFDVLPVSYLRAPPLAVAVGPDHRVWVNQEFHIQTMQVVDPTVDAAQAVARLPVPRPPDPGPFGSSFDDANTTQASALGEDVLVAPDGSVWFSQGGSNLYTGNASNHARVVQYRPSAPEGEAFRVYDLPGDYNEAIGMAWDAARGRLWVAQAGFRAGAALWSFDPEGAPRHDGTVAPTGSEEGVCPPAGPFDDCFRRYDLPRPTSRPSHVVVDDAGLVRTTLMWGNALGRLDPGSGAFVEYPLPASRSNYDWFFGGAPWELLLDGRGNVVFTEFVDLSVGRMALADGDDARCRELDRSGRNPCIEEVVVLPGLDHADGYGLHSLALDGDRLWFTPTAADVDGNDLSVGYLTPDWEVVMLPSLRHFPADDSVHSSGIAVDGETGDVWFAEYERRRVGRLQPVG